MLCDPQTFSLTNMGNAVEEEIFRTETIYDGVTINKYVIMLNHVHLLMLLEHCETSVSVIIGQMKKNASKRAGQPIWQKSFFDHVVRNEADYLRIWEYIEENPKKWCLDRYYTDEV